MTGTFFGTLGSMTPILIHKVLMITSCERKQIPLSQYLFIHLYWINFLRSI